MCGITLIKANMWTIVKKRSDRCQYWAICVHRLHDKGHYLDSGWKISSQGQYCCYKYVDCPIKARTWTLRMSTLIKTRTCTVNLATLIKANTLTMCMTTPIEARPWTMCVVQSD